MVAEVRSDNQKQCMHYVKVLGKVAVCRPLFTGMRMSLNNAGGRAACGLNHVSYITMHTR